MALLFQVKKTLSEKEIDFYINSVKAVVKRLKMFFHFIALAPFQNLLSRKLVSSVVRLAVLNQKQNIQTDGSKIQSF